MKISKDELIGTLTQFNPWWKGESIPDLPPWKRAAWGELKTWLLEPPTARAIMLSGARQVGKTTLLLQAIDTLIENHIPPSNILYATFDHPILKLAGLDAVIEAWREREPRGAAPEFIFLDEVQFIRNCGTWIKHQVDFFKDRRIFFTGSAMPLVERTRESGVGRWHTIRMTTLSFYEYVQLKKIVVPPLPHLKSLVELFSWPKAEFDRVGELSRPLIGHFHDYLVRGGFPGTAGIESVTQAQRLLREDIIDKVLKRDMTAIFGVRRIIELEHVFLYLCMHDGGLLDMVDLCKNLGVQKPTANNFIDLFEASHLVYRLAPFGYGKEVLRARYKIYLADPAIAGAVLLKGKDMLDDPVALGAATETATFRHLYARYYSQNVCFSYWRGSRDKEVDLVAQIEGKIVPFEVKYRSQEAKGRDLKGLLELCREKKVDHGYVVTKSATDFGPLHVAGMGSTRIMRLPAALLCYWLGQSELDH